MTNERLEEIRQKYIAFDYPDYYNCNELLQEIDDLQSDLRGYNAMMADRHRLLEENFRMDIALKTWRDSFYPDGATLEEALCKEIKFNEFCELVKEIYGPYGFSSEDNDLAAPFSFT